MFDLETNAEGLEGVVVSLVLRRRLDLLGRELEVLPFAVLPEGVSEGPVAVGTGLIPHVANVGADIAEWASVGQTGVVRDRAYYRRRRRRRRLGTGVFRERAYYRRRRLGTGGVREWAYYRRRSPSGTGRVRPENPSGDANRDAHEQSDPQKGKRKETFSWRYLKGTGCTGRLAC